MTLSDRENDMKDENVLWTTKSVERNDERDVWQWVIEKVTSKMRMYYEQQNQW